MLQVHGAKGNVDRTSKGPFIATQLNSTQLDVELSCVAINGPLACPFTAQTATHQWILFIAAAAAWTTTPKRIQRNLIVCIGKSEAEVTNNRRVRSDIVYYRSY